MTIGLDKKELFKLLSFGDTAEEIKESLFPSLDDKASTDEVLAVIIASLIEKIGEAILENNRRINEQLISVGLQI